MITSLRAHHLKKKKSIRAPRRLAGIPYTLVCSPGGTTIRAVHALEKGGMRAAVIDAVLAAAGRSAEMSKK